MTRTAALLVRCGTAWKITKTITCTVCGEMIDGSKVWKDTESGETYFLTRCSGQYFFWR